MKSTYLGRREVILVSDSELRVSDRQWECGMQSHHGEVHDEPSVHASRGVCCPIWQSPL